MHKEAVAIVRSADMKTSLSAVGADLIANTPAEFATAMREESERWARVIREAGIKGEWCCARVSIS